MYSKLIFFYSLVLLICLGCIRKPETSSKKVPDDSFSERKRQLSFEKVMKSLPNIMDVRDKVDLVVIGKLDEDKVLPVKIRVFERPGGRVIYKGSIKGIMNLPRNRITIPVSSSAHEIHGVFSIAGGGDPVEKKLYVLDSGEVIIRTADFLIDSFFEE